MDKFYTYYGILLLLCPLPPSQKQNLNDDGQNEMLLKEFRVYPHSSSTLQRVNLEAVDDPVLHFCLKSHRDAIQTSKLQWLCCQTQSRTLSFFSRILQALQS